MNFNRVIQPYVGVVATNNVSQSPVKYSIVNQQKYVQNLQQNGYHLQNGNVQTYFTPIKQDNRNVPHINITPAPSNSAQTTQMSPFQSYNSKQFTTVKGINDINQSINQNILVSNQLFSAQNNQNQQGSANQNNILEITNQIPQPPRNHHSNKRIFEDNSQKLLSQVQKQNYRANQSAMIEYDNSLGNISQRGNLRNSSFIRVGQQQGGSMKRNSSYEGGSARNLSKEGQTQQNTEKNSNLQYFKRNLVFDKINQQSFGKRSITEESNSGVIKQSDLIPGQVNNEYDRGQITILKRNDNLSQANSVFMNNTNTIKGYTNNTSSSLFVLNTSQDQFSKASPNKYYSNDQGQMTQQSQHLQPQIYQNQTNTIKREFTPTTLTTVKYTPKQEIFSFENSQIHIEDQVETPLAPHLFQNSNFTQAQQNTEALNFFSTNQNDLDTLGFPDEKQSDKFDEFNSHNHKVSLLEVSNNDTQEANIVSQLAGINNNDYVINEQEEQALQQPNKIEIESPNRIKELIAENYMLRNNLQEIKDIYNSQQNNIVKFQQISEENNELKLQIIQLQLQNQEYEKKIVDLEKPHNITTSQNYNSNGSNNQTDKRMNNALFDQIKDLQEKVDLLSKEKVKLMELLLNQEKMYNTLSLELQKSQGSPEKQRLSQPIAVQQVQGPHPKYLQQLEDQVKSQEENIEDLKTELMDKDNLIQQMQFELKDSQKQLGLFSDQILVLKEKISQKEENQRQVQLEKELIAMQDQNKNLMDINNSLKKQQDMQERIKRSNNTQSAQQEQPPQKVQLSKYFEKNRENELQIKHSLGGQAYLNLGGKNNNQTMQYNKQNYDKFTSNNNKYSSIKNQNQILFTVNSSRRLQGNRDDDPNCSLSNCQFNN